MTSCDTNVLFAACDADSPHHAQAVEFLRSWSGRDDFCLCEQVLIELYCLLRNPTVCVKPLSATDAVNVIQRFRSNPRWRTVDQVLGSDIMRNVWRAAADRKFAYRRIFDARLALILRHHGVKAFATRNLKDFNGFGFVEVWDPLA
ncbi:MAG: PIN domain-containing protein [Verrucomicrobia bacterium]|nr:PIN domain-containing protein [Verrucomicrobiota bacterium]